MTAITMTPSMLSFRMAKIGPIDMDTKAKCVEIINAAANAGHDIWYVWGAGGGEHSAPPGLALDLMVKNEAAGDWVRNYIWVNRARLRLRHVIWEQHITSTVTSPGVRRWMPDRGSTTNNHYDHNHVRFLDGATYVPPGKVAAPSVPKTVDATLDRGDKGPRVLILQKGLKAVFPSYAGDLDLDSSFGPDLERVVMEYQRRSGLATDGRVGPAMRESLAEHKIIIPLTDPVATKPKPAPAPAPKPSPKPKIGGTMARGEKSDRVEKFQRDMKRVFFYAKNLKPDGSFGPATEDVVIEFQRRSGLSRDGRVGPKTRAALARSGIKV